MLRMQGFWGSLLFGCFCLAETAAAVTVQFQQDAEVEGRVVHSVVKIRDDFFRIDTLADGMQASVIRNADGLFNLIVDQGFAMKLPEGPESGNDFTLIERVQDYSAYLQQESAEMIGVEEIDGRLCDVYTVASQESKVWLDQESRFPVRVETGGSVVTFSDVDFEVAIDDAVFILPADVQVFDLDGIDLSRVFQEPGDAIPAGVPLSDPEGVQ